MDIKEDKKQIFIEKARLIHGDKYDYSKVDYVNNLTKVCILCSKHGEFFQKPKYHLQGQGCPKCANRGCGANGKRTLDEFIYEANLIHNNNYDYSKSEYVNANEKLIITCPLHGDFSMCANNHLRGQGCPKCANKIKGCYQKSNTEDFIKKSIEVHGKRYDYSKVDYVNNRIKVTIGCKEHGYFTQKPLDHLNGSGCPECGKKYGISERKVFDVLKEKYKTVEYQYKPKWLYGKTSPQSLDIFLLEYNIGIEYQGRQHFYPNEKFGGKEEFLLIQERDKRKYDKCKENGVEVFYISFERKIPDNYFSTIYRNTNDLINAIEEYINNNINNNLKK